jgi:hypothetical protein
MLAIGEENFEQTLLMIQQIKAHYAYSEMQRIAQERFPNGMTEEEIETEISAARRGESEK